MMITNIRRQHSIMMIRGRQVMQNKGVTVWALYCLVFLHFSIAFIKAHLKDQVYTHSMGSHKCLFLVVFIKAYYKVQIYTNSLGLHKCLFSVGFFWLILEGRSTHIPWVCMNVFFSCVFLGLFESVDLHTYPGFA